MGLREIWDAVGDAVLGKPPEPEGTPTTPKGMRKYDHLTPEEAIRRAWTEEGTHPQWHRVSVSRVRKDMPLLARALDRLERD